MKRIINWLLGRCRFYPMCKNRDNLNACCIGYEKSSYCGYAREQYKNDKQKKIKQKILSQE